MGDNYQTRRRVIQLAGAAAAGGIATGTTSAEADERGPTVSTDLTGEAVPRDVETDATGTATFDVDLEAREVAYEVSVERLCHATEVHVHLGGPSEDGPVVARLHPEGEQEPETIEGRFDGVLAEGTLTGDDLVGPLEGAGVGTVAQTLAREGAYVDVHTETYPDGELRGQLEPGETDIGIPEPVGYSVETVAEGLEHPWGIAFLPNRFQLLVTELEGRLSLVDRRDGSTDTVAGTPDVYAEGQGGLLDVALHPDYPVEPWVYLTYAGANDEGKSATHLGRGRLDCGSAELTAFEELVVVEPFRDPDLHYGSRVVFGDDGMLYMSTGDRRDTDFGPEHVSQDAANGIGATLRLEPDGSIPDDNPFVDDEDALDAIYSYGHRNVQALTVHPDTGELWLAEHGEEDGDAIHVAEAGGNHGWPVAHYGCEYDTDIPIGDEPHERDDVVNPVHYWECGSGGFPPSGMTVYDGAAFPQWQGDLFVGNLAGEYLGRFTVDDGDVAEEAPLLADRGWRIRDVAVAPDTGHLYVVVDDEDATLVRLVPETPR